MVSICCDADKRKTRGTQKERHGERKKKDTGNAKRKTRGTQKGLIEKHIYSSKKNKIEVNLVKQ